MCVHVRFLIFGVSKMVENGYWYSQKQRAKILELFLKNNEFYPRFRYTYRQIYGRTVIVPENFLEENRLKDKERK